MNIVIFGLSITSSWGNGHATTFRSLVKGLKKKGHSVIFFERNKPWYYNNRDLSNPEFCEVYLYESLYDLKKFSVTISNADLVIVGSYVPEGVAVSSYVLREANGVKAFYDIDTPVTYSKIQNNDYEYISPDLIPEFDIYLSFTGGKILEIFKNILGARNAKPLYCSVDPELYYPVEITKTWDMGYLGTYSADRQPGLNEFLLKPAEIWKAGKFIVAGPQFPSDIKWPNNVRRLNHVPPYIHNKFYNKQRFTLNITRRDMVSMGYSPSVRLFEAAACGIPVITDTWEGLSEFFIPGQEIVITNSAEYTVKIIKNTTEDELKMISENAREKVLKYHTGEQRADELIGYVNEIQKTDRTIYSERI